MLAFWVAVASILYPLFPPAVQWLDPLTHDFGSIPANVEVRHDFRFLNTGTEPVLIDNVRTDCGCTAPDWKDEPVLPGAVGVVTVYYDAHDKGYFLKPVKVFLRGRRKAVLLYIEGDVIAR